MAQALRTVQPAISVKDQIRNLKSLGLTFGDESAAETFLKEVSYFRLIKGYSIGLKPKNGSYYSGVTFEDIVALYEFNARFRHLIFHEIEKVEVGLRCRVADHFSNAHGPMGYTDSSHFPDPAYHARYMSDVAAEIKRNRRAAFIRNFQTNYANGDIPFYALVEIFSFGMLSMFFKNMSSVDKKAVARTYGTPYTYLESWFECLAYVRNICAHYGRLYNAKLTKTPMIFKQAAAAGVRNDRVFGAMWCLTKLLPDRAKWQQFSSELDALLLSYPQAKIGSMGMPADWQKILTAL